MTNNEAPTSSSPLFCLANANDNITNQIFTGKRKANETTASEKPSSSVSSASGGYFFKLSSPLKNFHNLINHKFENKRNEISSHEIFNFNQPYQAKSFQFNKINFNTNNNNNNNNNSNNTNRPVLLVDQTTFSIMKSIKCQENNQRENNLVIINSNRNHPYIRSTNGQQISEKSNNYNNNNNNSNNKNLFNNTIANSNTSLNQKLNEKTNVISNDSLSSSSPIRNSSSNSILAQLKSISPSFKSIFVRPKTHKPIDASALFNKPKLHNKNVSLPQLRRDEYSLTNIQDSSLFLNNILPRIELKELRLNSSVDEILRKLANEDDVIRRTIKNYSNSNTSSDLNASQNFSKIAITNAEKSTFSTGLLSTEEIESSKLLFPSHSKDQVADMTAIGRSKWTCMVCLSKHSTKLDVCSICGSSKSSSISLQNVQEPSSTSSTSSSSSSSTLAVSLKKRQQQTTPLSSSTPSTSPSSKLFSSYLINELGLKQKYSTSSQPQQKKQITPNVSDNELSFTKKNPYIKKWTCLQCNYQNDSLKIVCLNCRWAKTSSKINKTESGMNSVLALDEPAVKRSKFYNNILTINVMDSVSQDKDTKKDKNNNFLCSSCKSPIKNDTSSSPEIIELHPSSSEATKQKEKEQPVTTPFPSFFAQKPLATESEKTTKWKCDTCLVSNPDTADKCLCCMTSKPGTSKPAVSLSENLNQLKPLSSISKWTCDTCLVSNDADKTNCVCCMTPKAGSTSSIKSSSTSLNMGTTFKLNETNLNPSILAGSSSIKFGSNASTSSMPIKFGAPSGTVIKFDIFKQSSEENQESGKTLFSTKTMELPKNVEKPFKFDLSSQPFLNGNKSDVESAPKFSFPSSLSNPIAPISSTSTSNELIFKEPNEKTNKSTIQTTQTLENSNKLESQAESASPFKFIPLGLNFSSSTPSVQTASVDSFFSPKTNTTSSTNTTTTTTNNTQISSAPSFSFLSNQSNNNKPNESVSSLSFSSTTPTRNLFEIVSPQPAQQFNTTNSFSSGNQPSSLFSNTKPSFSSSFGSTELQPNITAFGNVGATSNSLLSSSSQPFPQFDFKPTTSEPSFPSLNNQQQPKGFQFASFGFNIPNPTINFVENPSAIIFSGNTESGMNTSAEAPRRFRKAARKHHRY